MSLKNKIVNYIWFTWKLACILRIYRKCDPTIGFSKYEFNKLLVGVTFFRVTSIVTWTKPIISQFNVNFDKSTVRLHYLHIFFMLTKISRWSKINRHVINELSKFNVFVV